MQKSERQDLNYRKKAAIKANPRREGGMRGWGNTQNAGRKKSQSNLEINYSLQLACLSLVTREKF